MFILEQNNILLLKGGSLSHVFNFKLILLEEYHKTYHEVQKYCSGLMANNLFLPDSFCAIVVAE